MFRGKKNIEQYFMEGALPCWKLYDQRNGLISACDQCVDVQIGWKKLETIIDMIDGGIYNLVTTPSFENADAKKQRKVAIIIEGHTNGANAPAQMQAMYGTGIPGFDINGIIDMRVQNALLQHQVAELKLNPPAAAPGPLENAIAAALAMVTPVLPHMVKRMANNPAQPQPQPRVQAPVQGQQPALPAANDNTDEARLTRSLKTLNETVPDIVAVMEKLAQKAESNPEGLISAIEMIDVL